MVTHWLANFAASSSACDSAPPVAGSSRLLGGAPAPPVSSADVSSTGATAEEREEAIRRLQRAAGDIASAFTTLGIFGSATTGPLATSQPSIRNATYTDMARRYPQLAPNHLEAVVQSSVAATDVANQLALDRARPTSIVDDGNAIAGASTGSTGRRVGEQDSGDSSDGNTALGSSDGAIRSASILHPPTLLTTLQPPTSTTTALSSRSVSTLAPELSTMLGQALDQERDEASIVGSTGAATNQRLFTAAIGSDRGRIGAEAAAASRILLNLRAQMQSVDHEIGTLQRTIAHHQSIKDTMTRQREVAIALVDGSASARAEASQILSQGEELDLRIIDGKIQDAERVMAQLGRKLEELQLARSKTKKEYDGATGKAEDSWGKFQNVSQKFQDPFEQLSSASWSRHSQGRLSGSLLASVLGRQHYAGGSLSGGALHRQPGRLPSQLTLRGGRKSILQHRLSHAVTINCHLFYPIFSLKFDKTGKYFITGADDHLVKLFHLGVGLSATGRGEEGLRKFAYGANNRGVVLVCSLRGHAGVVTDLDVSCDNSMLATASQDGDVPKGRLPSCYPERAYWRCQHGLLVQANSIPHCYDW